MLQEEPELENNQWFLPENEMHKHIEVTSNVFRQKSLAYERYKPIEDRMIELWNQGRKILEDILTFGK